jgi:hypothetical protein
MDRASTRSSQLRRATLVAAGVLVFVAAPASADLGRLFFTPQQRAELDKRRVNPVVVQENVVRESAVTLNGYVRRSDGRTTTWVNGVPRYDSPGARNDGRVVVREPGGQVPLKVGETADLVSGGVRSALGDGTVRAVPTAPPR